MSAVGARLRGRDVMHDIAHDIAHTRLPHMHDIAHDILRTHDIA
jgi:hypothetical protein